MDAISCPQCGGALKWRSKRIGIGYCSDCDAAYRSPPPPDDELAAFYDQTYFDSWGEASSGDDSWRLKRRLYSRLLASVRGIAKGDWALDVGCAMGAGLSVLADMGLKAYGIDVNPHAVRMARQRVPEAQVIEGAIEDVDLPHGTFALVVLSDVLEHVRDPNCLLASVFELLRPDGQIVVLTPDIHSASARFLRSWWPHYKPEHLVLFSRGTLKAALEACGFVDIRVRSWAKPLSLSYAAHQFQAYPFPVVSPLVRKLVPRLPVRWQQVKFPMPMWEMLMNAVKGPARPGEGGASA